MRTADTATRNGKPLDPTATPAVGDRFTVGGATFTLIEKRGADLGGLLRVRSLFYVLRAEDGGTLTVPAFTARKETACPANATGSTTSRTASRPRRA